MKKIEKFAYLEEHHFQKWLRTRKEVDEEVSSKYSMFCVCGKLCTGLHEMHCRRFQTEVNNTTLKRLEHLIVV